MGTTSTAIDMHQILFATDFSSVAERAGEYAYRLAQNLGACLEIGHAIAPPNDDRSEESWRAEVDRREQNLHQRSQDLQRRGVKAHSCVSTDCPVSLAISLMQKRTGADLIVVGTESKSSFDRLLLGSTAEALIREGAAPVLTVGPRARPPHKEGHVFRNIVLATDFSGTSERAEAFALSLALQLEAKLHLFHLDKSVSDEDVSDRWLAETSFRNQVMQCLTPERYQLSKAQDEHGGGGVGESIVRYATTVHADLIVMGARERSFWLLHVRRGVTQDVLATAECPVLTVR